MNDWKEEFKEEYLAGFHWKVKEGEGNAAKDITDNIIIPFIETEIIENLINGIPSKEDVPMPGKSGMVVVISMEGLKNELRAKWLGNKNTNEA